MAATAGAKALGARVQGRPLYVAVTDSKGEPKTGLTAADLVVEVNGKVAAVASVAPAAEPIAIVVVTEGMRSEMISEIRKMMKAVVVGAGAVHPDSRVGLMIEDHAAAPRMHTVTTDVQQLDAEMARFLGTERSGADPRFARSALLDSILIAAQTLSFEKHARRAIVAVTRGNGAETDVMSPTKVALAVRQSGASLWALDLGGRDTPIGSAEQRVLSDVTAISGGRRERSTDASIAFLTERIMATLRGQYAITLEDGIAPKSATPRVSARARGLKVLVPAWPAVK